MNSSKLTLQDNEGLTPVPDRSLVPPHHHLHFKTYLFILLVVIFSPLGNVLLSTGMKQAGPLTIHSLSDVYYALAQVFTTPVIWLGIASLIAYFISYMLVLSWADYSYVQPATAMGYVIVALLGHFALHETVTPLRWIGIAIIFLGVVTVGNTPPRTTGHH